MRSSDGLPPARRYRLPEQLWEALLAGADLVTEVPADRWDADEYYDPERGGSGPHGVALGAFIDDIAGFDAPFFGLDDQRATAIDPSTGC